MSAIKLKFLCEPTTVVTNDPKRVLSIGVTRNKSRAQYLDEAAIAILERPNPVHMTDTNHPMKTSEIGFITALEARRIAYQLMGVPGNLMPYMIYITDKECERRVRLERAYIEEPCFALLKIIKWNPKKRGSGDWELESMNMIRREEVIPVAIALDVHSRNLETVLEMKRLGIDVEETTTKEN